MRYHDKEIFYLVDGDLNSNKPIIILLNGIMMSTGSWDQFKSAFSENNTLIRFDMLDQGETSKAVTQYTQEIQVDILHHLIQFLHLDKVNLVGISYGASVALQFTIKHQECVNKLIVANVVMKTSKWLKAIGDGWNQVSKSRDGLAYYNITIPYIYSPTFYSLNIDWMERRKDILVPLFSDDVFLNAMARLTISAETHDTRSGIGKITSDTLIISSELDFLTPVFEQKEIKDHIQNSHMVIIPDCGHASMYEQPEIFTTLILGFINNKHIPKIV
jgi:pimeloyl-ACP methyl ester carboxylesterase